jgi:hypothetical protein
MHLDQTDSFSWQGKRDKDSRPSNVSYNLTIQRSAKRMPFLYQLRDVHNLYQVTVLRSFGDPYSLFYFSI